MYTHLKEVNLTSLKNHCTLIHYFGLGFIQVKLGETHRMHFYTPLLPAIVGDEDVHNHRYDFTSHIFSGVFSQEIFEVTPGTTHLHEAESCREGVTATEPGKICGIEKTMEQTFTTGSHYFISHRVFHRVKAVGDCITFVTRDKIMKEFAEVIRPINSPKVCPFSNKVPEAELWSIIEKMLVKR